MRAVVVVSLLALLCPAAASAQSASTTAVPGRKDMTKDQYVERAKQRASARFDKADTNRDGVLSAAERRAARPKRRTTQ